MFFTIISPVFGEVVYMKIQETDFKLMEQPRALNAANIFSAISL